MTNLLTIHSFLLIDNALLSSAITNERKGWLLPIYEEAAIAVSPLVIDIEAAYESGQLVEMMALLNAVHPQLHVSIIDTALSHAELVQHLRRFIMIRTHDGRDFTLRFADCLGLPVLAATFSAEQWSAFAGEIKRWCVHDRDGVVRDLPLADRQQTPSSTPLVLTALQPESLADATGPDEMIANIREMRQDRAMPGSVSEQHRWALAARVIWRSAGGTDLLVLRWLTAAALDSGGAILEQSRLPSVLGLQNKAAVRAGLDALGGTR